VIRPDIVWAPWRSKLTDEFGALLAEDLTAKLEKIPPDPARFAPGVRTAHV
jgi:hypothetical protein